MSSRSSNNPWPVIFGVSALAVAFIVWWIYFKTTGTAEGEWVTRLPALNAALNTLCACCLVGGYRAIRRGDRDTHRRFMLAAVSFSALFFVSYLTYHHFHGDTKFPGQGLIRPVYFFILISHILLSIAVVPMVLSTVYFAARGSFERHRAVARFTLPVWLYVSVTGVAIFFLLSAYT